VASEEVYLPSTVKICPGENDFVDSALPRSIYSVISDQMVYTPRGPAFGEQFRCTPVLPYTPINPVVIPFSGSPMRVLLVSDSHIGASADAHQSIAQYLAVLSTLIQSERPTHLVHLGDMIHGPLSLDVGAGLVSEVVTGLDLLRIPTWIIGGNHDREFVAAAAWPETEFVHRVTELAMVINLPGKNPPERVFLSHDMGNNYKVWDESTYSYLAWVKEAFKTWIKPTDWLVTGHCRTMFLSFDSRLGCVGQFAPEIKAYGYTMLEIGTSMSFNLRYLPDPPPARK
jgi:predicted phosphodiesterase